METTEAEPRHLFRTVVPPIVLPVFLAAADSTVVATALPAIAAAFGEVERLPWIVVINLIASTVSAPTFGRLADMFGRRRMMVAALTVFLIASLGCALAPSFNLLLAARALQGFGGGGLVTLAQALVGELVPVRQRGSYQGYLSANIVAGATLGPVLGGFLTALWGWSSVFLAWVPLSLIAIALVMRLPKGSAAAGGPRRFDLVGMVLLTAFVLPLLLAVYQLQRLEMAMVPRMALYLAMAGAALAALLWQQRRTPSPLLPLTLFPHPAFWRANVMAAGSGASLTALSTFLPIYFQVVMGASPSEVGLLLIPLTASVSGGSVITGWLISKTGRTAIFPALGLVVTGASLVALAVLTPGLSRAGLSWMLAFGGVCQGSAMLTAQITVQAVGGARQLGAAAASVQLARSLGSAFGAAVAGAVLFGVLSAMDPATAELFFETVRRGPGVLAALSPDRQDLVRWEIATAFRGVFLTVACFSATIVVMAATLPVRRL